MPERKSVILLAAGQSRRMGCAKPLLPLGERTVIGQAIDNLTAAGWTDLFTVIRQGDESLEQALRRLPTNIVRNADPESDMSGSLRRGLAALPSGTASVLVALADCPLVSVETLRLLARHPPGPGRKIVIPTFAGRSGHPTLFHRPVLEEIESLPTLRDVVRRDAIRVLRLPTEDPGVLQDLDTPADYREACRVWESHSGSLSDF